MATKNEFEGYNGGIEGKLSGLGVFFLTVGIIGFIVCLIVSGLVTKTSSYSNWAEDGLSPTWIAISVFCLLQGIALNIIFKAGSEIIMLLKKLNGLKFGGRISEPDPITLLKCSECGNIVTEYNSECDKCSSKFTN